jgi:hypothetical protein
MSSGSSPKVQVVKVAGAAEGAGGAGAAGAARATPCGRRPPGRRSRGDRRRQAQRRQGLEGRARLAAELGLELGQMARLAELAAVLVDDAQVHQQMRRQLLVLEVGAPDLDAALGPHVGRQHVEQAAVAEGMPADEAFGIVRQGHETRARPLRQGLRQRHQLVLQHPRHQPFAAILAGGIEGVERHGDGDAVARVARLVQVGAAQSMPPSRIVRGNACVVMPAASWRISSSRVRSSSSGWRRTSSRYQRSKVRASCTDFGTCWS